MRSETDTRLSVAVVVYDGLSLFEFAAACEVFGNRGVRDEQGDFAPPVYRVEVCGEQPQVVTDHGLTIDVPRRLASLARADVVVLPPCQDPTTVPERTLAAVRRAHDRGARVVSLCTGAFVLARTGLLDGRRAVTHWQDCATFAAAHPEVTVDPSVLYVDDGDILTSAGSAASIDLCLHVVRTDHGARVANRLARDLVVPPHRDGGQAQYTETPMPPPPDEDPFSATLAWMHDHLHEPLTVEDLARQAATSERHFARRFAAVTGTTPHQWLITRRVGRAQQLLETTDLLVDAVAERSGLGNAANLRKQFRRHLQTSPHAYRSTFTTRTHAAAR
ncbi:GlxA family transcriptional regulator [Solicola sp. PLA-1-18]|uniref:GlxA family transcriptional regulator n=1 Tax=Solicola sp. PLA-1-18 TaxID=3380532 RepID=UPI003B7A26A0